MREEQAKAPRRWYLHRTALFLGTLAVCWAGWSTYSYAGARQKMDAALLAALQAREPVSLWVELPFPPEEFHIRYLQDRGTVTGVSGRSIHLTRVRPAVAWSIARLYWVKRVRGEGTTGRHAHQGSIRVQGGHVMPFYRFEQLPQETISPHYSTSAGGTVTGDVIEVGRYAMAKGTGADPHRHPNEQIIVVLRGKLRARVDEVERILEPGDVAHIPSNVVHEVRALEDSEFLSSKNLVEGKGSKGWSAAAPVRDRAP